MSDTGVKSIRGFSDVLPEQSRLWRFIEETAAELFRLYGFSRIRTPVLEFSDIYKRAIGDSTDIVEKEMYSFHDRDGSEITLRPEGTAGVARAFIENSMGKRSPVNKLYYLGEMFRHERPQKGRMRGFYQIGAEFFGSGSPSEDCETVEMLWRFFQNAGLSGDTEMEINSMGTSDDRKQFGKSLVRFLNSVSGELCDDCNRRAQTNPLRVFDCKNENCAEVTKDAPVMADFLSPENASHFEQVKKTLGELSVPFKVNKRIVRGLDYYTRTVFEVKAKKGLGAQNAVAAGGRYDTLVETLGGPSAPAVGFAVGVERVALLLESKNPDLTESPDVFVGWIGKDCFESAFLLSSKLRGGGIKTRIEHSESGIKSQMKKADRAGAGYMAIIGPDEIGGGTVKIRDMKTGDERDFPRDSAAEGISELVKSAVN